MPEIRVLGVRHHGPGSARSLRKALEELRPDCILVEGPPDAADVLPLLTHENMQPPVALMLYAPDEPTRSAFYPFAVFSPEWQALHYGLSQGIPTRFMDLPIAHQLAMKPHGEEQESDAPEDEPPQDVDIRLDPLAMLAEAAGYSDGERWWEHMVEQRRDGADLFAALLEAMAELRSSVPPSDDPIETAREAHMRQTIRAAQKEGLERIAVVCGAWHGPVLADMPKVSEDTAVLKGLPKIKVQATWVPWTYDRLSYWSGYGAGIQSPGWYHHLWTSGDQVTIRWMTGVAQCLRDEDLDASSAHIIEAVRLAESLAALRDRPLPGLPELNDAIQSVFCFGSDMPMRLIFDRLIVGRTLGSVPESTPMVPLQQDLSREQKRLRMQPDAAQKMMDLDLRKETDLDRSHLLHRLNILGIGWGEPVQVGRKSGTFHEIWKVQWQPEFAIAIVDAAKWGNTVLTAASEYTSHAADEAGDLGTLAELLDRALLAEIPDAVSHLMERLQAEAAVASDVIRLMDALPALANVLRYGNVRRTDVGMVSEVVDGLVARICIGLPGACSSLDEEAVEEMFGRFMATDSAISLLDSEEHTTMWRSVLRLMSDQQGLHGLIAGRCCRILLDVGEMPAEETARRMSLALSMANDPVQAAGWVEGFLRGSGLLLLHDESLWQVLDGWVTDLAEGGFTNVLPLVRRTFSSFQSPERRQMGEKVRRGLVRSTAGRAAAQDVDVERAEAVLPLVARLLGVPDNVLDRS